jgi:hypothetical protein
MEMRRRLRKAIRVARVMFTWFLRVKRWIKLIELEFAV